MRVGVSRNCKNVKHRETFSKKIFKMLRARFSRRFSTYVSRKNERRLRFLFRIFQKTRETCTKWEKCAKIARFPCPVYLCPYNNGLPCTYYIYRIYAFSRVLAASHAFSPCPRIIYPLPVSLPVYVSRTRSHHSRVPFPVLLCPLCPCRILQRDTTKRRTTKAKVR